MIFLNNVPIIPTIFPDGTSQVWHLAKELFEGVHAEVIWKFKDEAEFIHLAQLKSLITNRFSSVSLVLPYLPYARQDKTVSNDATFALTPFADLLNTLSFDEVIVMDPHSPVAIDLIKNIRPKYPIEIVKKIFKDEKYDLVCYPDFGANNKYQNRYLLPSVAASKIREQSSGRIEGVTVEGDVKGQRILMVDDICDGGATFVALARELREKGAIETDLFVTHGLFTRGKNFLFDQGITKIFTNQGEKHYDTSNFI